MGDGAEEPGVRVGAGVGGVEPFDDAEQDEERGLEQVGDQGGEVVVVAEADLGDADGVVLVDDRQAAPLDQGDDGVAGVEVAGAAVEVAGRQQELGRGDAVRRQTVLPGAHEKSLADRGTCLELAQVGGPAAQAEPADAGADGPGRDEHDLAAGGTQALHLVGQRPHPAAVQRAAGVGQHVGADLDHHRMGQGYHFLPDGINHQRRSLRQQGRIVPVNHRPLRGVDRAVDRGIDRRQDQVGLNAAAQAPRKARQLLR